MQLKRKIITSFILTGQFLSNCLQADSTTRLKKLNSNAAPASSTRSTYESLTSDRGTFALIAEADRKVKEQELQEAREQAEIAANEAANAQQKQPEGTIINFNNVSVTEVIRYVSRITGRNFIYDPQELSFNITIQSEAPTTVEDVMIMLLQNLRIHGFSIIEEGPNFIIHLNPMVRASAALYKGKDSASEPQIVSQVFCLQNVPADKCAAIVKTMLSENASIEIIEDSKIIITDLVSNIIRLSEIIEKLDVETSGLEVGQYVALNSAPTALISTVEQLVAPIAATKPLVLVPHSPSNSIFIVSTPYLVEKTLAVLQSIDLGKKQSGIMGDKFDSKAADLARQQKEEAALAAAKAAAGLAQGTQMTEAQARDLLKQQGRSTLEINLLNPEEAKQLAIEDLTKNKLFESGLPSGHAESTQFLIQKLQYRNCIDIAKALQAIAISLSGGTAAGAGGSIGPGAGVGMSRDLAQADLINTLNSLQPLEANNSIVFTGNSTSLQKVKELMGQIDTPVRQVLIETLVLDTSLDNSLEFGVEWAGKIKRTNFGAQVGFTQVISPFRTLFNNVEQFTPAQIQPPTGTGFDAGVIGRKIKFMGRGFRSTGSLIHAVSTDNETQVVLNPKISTEHNVPAEVFVGAQVPIKGQSIVNSTQSNATNTISTNYETRQVGILLRVTPLISSHETVTLIIEQKISSVDETQVAQQGDQNAPPATTKETRTLTRVHLPSDYFFVMSGLISEEKDILEEKLPCLGGIPFIGTFFSVKAQRNKKRNLLIFMRPIIIDTPHDIEEITKKEEDILKAKSRTERGWRKELKDIMEIANLPSTHLPGPN